MRYENTKVGFRITFGHEGPEINITEASDTSRYQTKVLLGMNRVLSSQPGF